MIVTGVLIVGGGIYFATKKSPEEKAAQVATQVENAVGDIAVSIPDMNFSASPLPDLNISALNVDTGAGSNMGNVFSAPTVNTDFSYKTGNIDIKTPTVSASDFNFTMPTIPTGGSKVSPPSNPNTGSENQGQGSETIPPSGSTGGQPSVDCSQFASVPSCSMTGPGEAMCKQCFPNK